MATLFISRHAGAMDWIRQQPNWQIDEIVPHLDLARVQAGDVIVGTLPIHLAAEVCAKGAKFYFLQMPQSFAGRGSEYTAEEMTAAGASLVQFDVKRIDE
ncbi:CRISPR-associated protein Csx16 [Kingella negevensis]|uniref:Putative CRISPR-associated protein (Cas_VVA1548) n=1 Tax=Kingella negevensis TaxID=1522312 RepID=A0A238HIE8_9NEIS|nr:CRISPR-associated protein Csx16 [Kingella negevensis]MDK4681161.1 CRISPR-associated protein Csx16 [Kingella negevensis]MDK4683364.1 CRISPR-associated protein Csx16 [Kingella negevensis]MDK4685396.1 CRISPR-associated protein Csx16 [Kingella negevensis]MDK4691506.1 CRISPR-associated protein Csx16 [Kingella negevensis]MDK4693343.1 CRISPR-associated protein Csx16 [Kingella negevensis]